MAKMKAVGAFPLPVGDPNVMVALDVDVPAPQGHDVLVQVKAVSVNPVDTKMRRRIDPDRAPAILGWDAAGVVEAVGSDVTLFQPGDEVYYAGTNIRPGCNSEYHVVDERIVGHKPDRLSFSEAAALPLTAVTAWEAMFERMNIPLDSTTNQNQAILIIGGAGGVGSIAIQLAKLAGLTVIATASRTETKQWVRSFGADYVINHYEDLAAQLNELGFADVPYALCLNNTDTHMAGMSKAIAPLGTICSIVDNGNPLNLSLLKDKSARFVWEFMFTRSAYQTPDMVEQHHILERIGRLVDDGKLRTTLTEVLSPINAENLRQAHAVLESGKAIGKIVLEDF